MSYEDDEGSERNLDSGSEGDLDMTELEGDAEFLPNGQRKLRDLGEVGAQYLHGNDMTSTEKREYPLVFMQPFYQPATMNLTKNRLEMTPMRLSAAMKEMRSKEMVSYGVRRMKDIRKLDEEFSEKIKEMLARLKREEMEKDKKGGGRQRWWHRRTVAELRDPLKSLKFNNLTLNPEELMNTRDIVLLQLTGANLGDEAMTWISGFLQQSYTVKRLNLQGNHITEEGCRELSLGLRGHKTLVELDISLNPIGDEGVASICNALNENARRSNMYKVNFSSCQLTSSAGFTLARLIRDFKPLQCLLLWRNNLGNGQGAVTSGAGMILEELRAAPWMRLVDLSANCISDKDASDHASARESEARKRRLMDIDKRTSAERLEQLRKEIAAKRKAAVWDDEKTEIQRMERTAVEIRQKVNMLRSLEKQKTVAERQEAEFGAFVSKGTGGLELTKREIKCRLILTGNHAISANALVRLREFYDLSRDPDVENFLTGPRRHDKVVNPRRELQGEYPGLRDPESHDAHQLFPWEKNFDADQEYARRQALVQWREDERIREEQAKPAHFEKFALKAPPEELGPDGKPRPPTKGSKMKKLVAGIQVASGINARIKTTATEGVSAKPREIPKPVTRTSETTTTTVVKPEVVKTIVAEPEVVTIKKKADDAATTGETKQPTTEPPATVTVTVAPVSHTQRPISPTDSAAAVVDVASEGESSASEGEWKGKDDQFEQLLPGAKRNIHDHSDDEEQAPQHYQPAEGEGEDDDGIEGYDELGEGYDEEEEGGGLGEGPNWASDDFDDAEYIQQKLNQRMAEVRSHLQRRTQAPKAMAAGAIEELPEEGEGGSAADAASGGGSPRPTPRSFGGDGQQSSHGGLVARPSVDFAALKKEMPQDAPIAVVIHGVEALYAHWETIRQMAEIGSPSDEDLRKLEEAREQLADMKRKLAADITQKGEATEGGRIVVEDEAHAEHLKSFVEEVVKETDIIPGNADLFTALVKHLGLPFATMVDELGLAAMAACDGSTHFLLTILQSIPDVQFDVVEVMCACFFNQTSRIPLAYLMLSKSSVNFADYGDDLSSLIQEFYEDIASNKRSIPREDRKDRMSVLRCLSDNADAFQIDYEVEGPDCQSVFTRALYEADEDLVKLILEKKEERIKDVNVVKGDGFTPLMQAVFSNDADVVSLLFDAFGSSIDGNYASRDGNALDLAVGLKRDPKVAEILKKHGVKSSGKKVPAKKTGGAKGKMRPGAGGGKKKVPAPAGKKPGARPTSKK